MSNWDKDRFLRLRESAVFNMEAYSGSYQDQSRNQLAMPGWGPSWAQWNGLPVIRGCTNGVGAASPVVDSIVDVTSTWSFELLVTSEIAGNPAFVRQSTATGGWGVSASFSATSATIGMNTFDNAGLLAVTYNTPPASTLFGTNRMAHVVGSVTGALSCACWVNGVVIATTVTNYGRVPANTAAAVRIFGAGGGSTGMGMGFIIRVYPFALTNADAAALYGAAKSLVGEI